MDECNEKIIKNKYKLIKDNGYNDSSSEFLCLLCGNTFTNSIHHISRLKTNSSCPFCEITKKNATKEQVEFKLRKLGEDFEIIEFNGISGESILKHNKCGGIITTKLERILRKHKGTCIHCAHGSIAYTSDYVKSEIENLTNGEYSVIGNYEREDKPFLIRHNECGYEWSVRRRNFIYRKTRCPYCSVARSKASEFIESYLIIQGKKYKREEYFSECKDYRPLPFDFYLEDYNLIIEFDGLQHFKPWGNPGDEDKYIAKLRKTHEHDLIKTNYCVSNNKNILRISYKYKEKDIIDIIESVFKYLSNNSDDSIFNYEFASFNNLNENYYLNNGLILSD